MAKTVNISEMDTELYNIMKEYKANVTKATKKAVDSVADGVMREIQSHITWNDKVYSKSFELTKIYDNESGKYVIWHVKNPHWRLTHLLELGHITRDGTSYSQKYPHVQYGQEFAYNNLTREIKERVEQVK